MVNFSGKKVAVFGMARSGLSAIKLLSGLGAEVFAVNSGEPVSWKAFNEVNRYVKMESCFDEFSSESIFENADLIILSPGIPREHKALEKAVKANVPIWSEIELAYRLLKNEVPIIAVTGTNGKTTTVTMIGEVLKNTGRPVFVGGNIGIPFCEYVLNGEGADYIVLELSSFQLESLEEFRPNVAMVLNIFPNHGERYESVEGYARAKFNIVRKMKNDDILYYSKSDPYLEPWGKSAHKNSVGLETKDYEVATEIISRKYSLDNFKLLGGHNITNLLFIVKAMDHLGIDKKYVQKAIDEFCGVDFRCQYIESSDKFAAYNDGKSTNWDAVKTAVKAVPHGRELILILGGQPRGRGDTLVPHFDVLKRCKEIYLMGETTEHFAKELDGVLPYKKLYDLKSCVEEARKTGFDGYLIFSPGLPSFDQYENYVKRGEHFTQLIKSRS